MRNYLVWAIVWLLPTWAVSQHGLPQFLQQVQANNAQLRGARAALVSDSLKARTGIYLADPAVAYAYWPGSPSGAGIQQEVSLTQPMDWPTVYSRRKAANRVGYREAEYRYLGQRQQVLYEASLAYVAHIHQHRILTYRQQELAAMDTLLARTNRAYQVGGVTVLNWNRAQLARLEAAEALAQAELAIAQNLSRLRRLSGTDSLTVRLLQSADTAWVEPAIPPLDMLEAEIHETDPGLLIIKAAAAAQEAQIRVARAEALPRFEIGYTYQNILGQAYQGPRVGVRLPIWSHRNVVQQAAARAQAAQAAVATEEAAHHDELQQAYSRYQTLQTQFNARRTVLAALRHPALLARAYELRELTLPDYLRELQVHRDAVLRLLNMELEVFQTAIWLLRHRL